MNKFTEKQEPETPLKIVPREEISMFLRRAFLYLEDDVVQLLSLGSAGGIVVKSRNLDCYYTINLREQYFTVTKPNGRHNITPRFYFNDLKQGADALHEMDTTKKIKSIYVSIDYEWSI